MAFAWAPDLRIVFGGTFDGAAGLSQPNVSSHLRRLGECGLVAGEQDGRFLHHRLDDRRSDRLLALADELLAGTARRVGGCKDHGASRKERAAGR